MGMAARHGLSVGFMYAISSQQEGEDASVLFGEETTTLLDKKSLIGTG